MTHDKRMSLLQLQLFRIVCFGSNKRNYGTPSSVCFVLLPSDYICITILFLNFLFVSRYRFANHYEYLSAWMEKMNLPKKIFLVTHDWGVIFGFHWANQHRDRVAGIAFAEGLGGAIPDCDFYVEDVSKALQVSTPILLLSRSTIVHIKKQIF